MTHDRPLGPWLRRIIDHRHPGTLAHSLRRSRFALFYQLTAGLPRPVKLLDVGGEQVFWERMGLGATAEYKITLLNRYPLSVTRPQFHAITGDAADLCDFADGEFDVVVSNSVIEHLESFEAQKCMAVEVQRVGRRYFVQTPNRFFPLEPHFLLPFFQFWPLELRIALMRRFNLGWYRRIPDPAAARAHVLSHRLLNANELRAIFPGGQLHAERLLGLTKSWIVTGGL